MRKALTERSNREWIHDLKSEGLEQEAALEDLRAKITSSLPYALSKWLSPSDPQFSDFAEEVAQDTLVRVLANLDSFEGRSKFTTWVYKISVRIALTELRRKRWRDVSLDEMLEGEEGEPRSWLLADPHAGPDQIAEQEDMLARVQRIILEELTDKQRQAIVASRIRGVPMEEVANKMGMNRNAFYKLVHDARLRMKKRLAEEGLTPEDVLESFESE